MSCTAFRGLFGQQGAFTRRRAAVAAKKESAGRVQKQDMALMVSTPATSKESEFSERSLGETRVYDGNWGKGDRYWYGVSRVDTDVA